MTHSGKKRVLIFLLGSLGDTLVAIPSLRAIRRHFGDADFYLLHNVQAQHIVNSAQVLSEDLIDGFIQYKKRPGRVGALLDFLLLRRMITSHRFSAVVNLVDTERPSVSVKRDNLFFRSCGIRDRIGFGLFSRQELYPVDERGWPAVTDHEAVRKLQRLERDGVATVPADLELPHLDLRTEETDWAKRLLNERGIVALDRLITIAPSCKQKANQWPVEHFIEVASFLHDRGFNPVILGGPADKEIAQAIAKKVAVTDTSGELTVRESAALMSLARFHIGLDTGPTHLAAAVGARCFVIYGQRVNPGQWYPLGGGHHVTAHPVACGGCRHETCPVPGHPCIRYISTQDVVENLSKFIDSLDTPRDAPVTVRNV